MSGVEATTSGRGKTAEWTFGPRLTLLARFNPPADLLDAKIFAS